MIEEYNPRIQFDWTQILKGQGEPDEPETFARAHRVTSRPQNRPAELAAEPRASNAPETRTQSAASTVDRAVEDEVEAAAELAQSDDDEDAVAAGVAPAHPVTDRPPTPAEARLGSEGVQRLRGRYADIVTGIQDRVPEGPRRDELKSQAERLNPDNWVTEEEVRLGLEQYESVFESLRPLAVRRRRRRHRRSGNPL